MEDVVLSGNPPLMMMTMRKTMMMMMTEARDSLLPIMVISTEGLKIEAIILERFTNN